MPRYSILPYILTFIITGSFFTVGYLVFTKKIIILSGNSGSLVWFIGFMALFGLIILGKGFALLTGTGYYYAIAQDEIIISSFFHKRKFRFSEIDSVIGLTFKQVADLIYRISYRQLFYTRQDLKFKEAFRTGVTLINLRKYSTFTLPQGYAHMNIGSGLISFGAWVKAIKPANLSGEFILVTLKDSKQFILSPKNVKAFLTEFRKH